MAHQDPSINEILSLCLLIDIRAEAVYRHFAALSEDQELDELNAFWLSMAEDERSHIAFWERVTTLATLGVIPQLFDDPGKTIRELLETRDKVEALMTRVEGNPDIPQQLVLAYRLEFYLLHPAFETFFHFMTSAFAEEHPEGDYEKHIHHFLEMFEKHGESTPELELLGEVLVRLWERNKVLARQSHQDLLTDLLNRRGFFNSVSPLLHHAKRRKLPVGVILLDIDNFKQINDSGGHLLGDRVLVEVARRIRSQVRVSDVTARYGGEEFIVFLFDIAEHNLKKLAEKIRLAIADQPIGGRAVTLSAGATLGVLEKTVETEFQQLINAADANLYEAKSLGKNCTVLKVSAQG